MEDRNKYIDEAVENGIENGINQNDINEIGKELEELVNSKESQDMEKE